MRNKKGQLAFYSLMLGIVVIILALSLADSGKEFVDDAMNASTADFIGLDCENESINNFNKGTCTILDFSLFYFFGGIILLGIAVIGANISIGGIR